MTEKSYTQDDVKGLIELLVAEYNNQAKFAIECTRELKASDVVIAASNMLGTVEKWAKGDGKEVEAPTSPETPQNLASAKSHAKEEDASKIAKLELEVERWRHESRISTHRANAVADVARALMNEAVGIGESHGLTHAEKRGALRWLHDRSQSDLATARWSDLPSDAKLRAELDSEIPF